MPFTTTVPAMRNGSLALGLVSVTAALAVTMPGAGVAAAPTATTIGSLPPTLNVTCLGGATLVQMGAADGTTPYSVPFDGVITSYSVKANANAGYQARMLLFSPP